MARILWTNVAKVSFVTAAVGLSGCAYLTQGPLPDRDRGAMSTPVDYFGDKTTEIVYPDQNWDAADSLWYYNTTQGSNLLPYDIFLNLEQADNTKPFRDNDNMQKYRYLIQKPTWDNEDGLPVGWVKDSYEGKDYVGLTCAACHTTQVNFQGKGIRIDGGPAMADMETLLVDLNRALDVSLVGEKFQRLAKNVLGKDAEDSTKLSKFKQDLTAIHETLAHYVTVNTPVHPKDNDKVVHYGYGRLDAFGRIYNRVLTHVSMDKTPRTNPANAPVSYPFLWDTPHHDFIQWNGVGDNGSALGVGPLGRNTGEVIGVFATLKVSEEKGKPGKFIYESSAESRNQVRIEDQLSKLWSPSWQELAKRGALPNIDQMLAQKGEGVFKEYQCAACHQVIDRTDSKRIVVAQFSSLDWIKTDPQMATNAMSYCGDVGVLKNAGPGTCPTEVNNENASAVLPIVSTTTMGVMTYDIFRRLGLFFAAIVSNPLGLFKENVPTQRHVELQVANKAYLNAYKGRPLNGIWATAPYLHNGSVPNLYELFLPSCTDAEIAQGKACRSNKFYVGNRELDTKKVGFVQLTNPGQFREPELYLFDAALPSNRNSGHEYSTGRTPMPKLVDGKVALDEKGEIVKHFFSPINDEKRLALVEYLKTL